MKRSGLLLSLIVAGSIGVTGTLRSEERQPCSLLSQSTALFQRLKRINREENYVPQLKDVFFKDFAYIKSKEFSGETLLSKLIACSAFDPQYRESLAWNLHEFEGQGIAQSEQMSLTLFKATASMCRSEIRKCPAWYGESLLNAAILYYKFGNRTEAYNYYRKNDHWCKVAYPKREDCPIGARSQEDSDYLIAIIQDLRQR